MTTFSIKFSHNELQLLTALASDQLFRREFIDPKIPGNRLDPVELTLGKKLVERLRLITDSKYATRVRLQRSNTAKA